MQKHLYQPISFLIVYNNYLVGMMKEQEKNEKKEIETLSPQDFKNVGILEIRQKNGAQQVYYGVGIFFGQNNFITLARYFTQDVNLAVFLPQKGLDEQICLKKSVQHSDFFQKYQILEKSLKDNMLIGKNNVFVRLTIKDIEEDECPQLLHRKDLPSDQKYVGKIIGLPKGLKEFRLLSQNFKYGHISDIKLPLYSAALIFLMKGGKYYFYGFFDNVNEFGSEDYFLSRDNPTIQSMIKRLQTKELYQEGEQQFQISDAKHKKPYKWIGVLTLLDQTLLRKIYSTNEKVKIIKCTGTAQALYDKVKRQCNYLITCAHNFLNQSVDLREQRSQYSFTLLSDQIPEQPDRYFAQKKCEQFEIKQVYIPKAYQEEIKTKQKFRTNFDDPSIDCKFTENQLNDIAFVQLFKPLKFFDDQSNYIKLEEGFRLNLFEKPFKLVNQNQIEISGYPANGQFDKIYKKQYTSYNSKRQSETKKVQVSKEIKINKEENSYQMIKHHLSTLKGNSGSPIYQNQQQKPYLFGIHTGGVKSHTITARFAKKSSRFQPISFGLTSYDYCQYNYGTYLYSKSIYEWFLTLPYIHTVTDNFKELIRRIAVIEYNQAGLDRFSLGLVSSSRVNIAESPKVIKKIYIKRNNQMALQENILQFKLSQTTYQKMNKQYAFALTNKFRLKSLIMTNKIKLKGLLFKPNSDQNNLKLQPYNGEDLHQYKGLAIGIDKVQKYQKLQQKALMEEDDQENRNDTTVSLKISVFNAQDISQPKLSFNPAFLFVYNYQNNNLIWSYYDEDQQAKKQPLPYQQYLQRVAVLMIQVKNLSTTCIANILFNKSTNDAKYLITAAHNVILDEKGKQTRNQVSVLNPQTCKISYKLHGVQFKQIGKFEIMVPSDYFTSEQQENQILSQVGGLKEQKHYPIRKSFAFDVAIIKLETSILVKNGFRIKRVADIKTIQNQPVQFTSRTVGYDLLSHQLLISQGGSVQILKYEKDFHVLKHSFSTVPGFGSCAISFNQYIFGIHTRSQIKYNIATYIYQPQIYEWLLEILVNEDVLD